MSTSDLVTLFCFVVGGLGAFFTAFHPNILYAAVALVFSLLSVAGLYGVLGADFLAATQLIVYVGGILIVILFAVMMSGEIYKVRFFSQAKKYALPVVLALVLFVLASGLFLKTPWGQTTIPSHEPTARALGWALVGPYALVFQYVAIVLLLGLIGAVVIARPGKK